MSEQAHSARLPRTAEHVRLHGAPPRPPRSTTTRALAVALGCVAAMALTWVLAQLVPALHLRDAILLRDFTNLATPRIESACGHLLDLLSPGLFVLWGIALAAIAVATDRPRLALAIVVVMGCAPLTSELLKPVLAHAHDSAGAVRIGEASWPSGHSTAALALALSVVLVTPPRWRWLAAIAGAAFSLAVGCALLILAWHMPSDVIGGYLVAGLWTALAVAALSIADRHRPPRRSSLG